MSQAVEVVRMAPAADRDHLQRQFGAACDSVSSTARDVYHVAQCEGLSDEEIIEKARPRPGFLAEQSRLLQSADRHTSCCVGSSGPIGDIGREILIVAWPGDSPV